MNALRIPVRILVWVGVAAAVAGFFLPWANLDLQEPSVMKQVRQVAGDQEVVRGLTKGLGKVTATIRRGTKTVTGDLPSLSDVPHHVSGAQIPQMANQQNAKVAAALVEVLMNERQHIGAKSYLVYLLPGLALLCGLLLNFLGGVPAVAMSAAILCAGVAGGGFWKLLTTNTKTLFIAITIGPGLWLSLWGYVAIAVAGLLRGVEGGRK